MDVLVVEGKTARTVRNGSWAFETAGPNTFQRIWPLSIAAADSALVIAGTYHSLLGGDFAAITAIPLQGRIRFWSDLNPKNRFTARVHLAAHARHSNWLEWASGARTSLAPLHAVSEALLIPNSESSVWAIEDERLLHFDGWSWKKYDLDVTPISVIVDAADTLWLLTDSEVRIHQEGAWVTIPTPKPFPVSSIAAVAGGHTWFIGTHYLAVWNGNAIVPVKSPLHTIDAVCQTPDGRTYFVGSSKDQGPPVMAVLPQRDLGSVR
jgi:hypothetical protein